MTQHFDPALSPLKAARNGLRSEPQSHDELLMVATSRFCDTDSRDRLGHRQYIEAFELLIGSVTQPTRQMVARLLAFCPFAPRELVLKFAYDTLDVALPILRNSQALSQLDLLTLINRVSNNHCAAIAMRPDLGATAVKALRALKDETVNSYLNANEAFPVLATKVSPEEEVDSPSRAEEAKETAQEPTNAIADALDIIQMETVSEPEYTIEFAREEPRQTEVAQDALLQVAARGGRLDIAPPPLAPRIDDQDWDFGTAMENAARTGGRQALCNTLMRRYGIDLVSANQVMEDESGDTLAVALKASKVEKGQANRIQILAHPTIGLSVQNAMRSVRFYANLTAESCLEAIDQWPKAETQPMLGHAPVAADTDDLRQRDIGAEPGVATSPKRHIEIRRVG